MFWDVLVVCVRSVCVIGALGGGGRGGWWRRPGEPFKGEAAGEGPCSRVFCCLVPLCIEWLGDWAPSAKQASNQPSRIEQGNKAPPSSFPSPGPSTELDFLHEAENAERCRRNLDTPGSGVRGRVAVPAVDGSRTSHRVLTMEFIDGERGVFVLCGWVWWWCVGGGVGGALVGGGGEATVYSKGRGVRKRCVVWCWHR